MCHYTGDMRLLNKPGACVLYCPHLFVRILASYTDELICLYDYECECMIGSWYFMVKITGQASLSC